MSEVTLPLQAMRRTATDLEASYAPRPCDSDGLSVCSRCNIVALARWSLRLLNSLPEDSFRGVERNLTVTVGSMSVDREEPHE